MTVIHVNCLNTTVHIDERAIYYVFASFATTLSPSLIEISQKHDEDIKVVSLDTNLLPVVVSHCHTTRSMTARDTFVILHVIVLPPMDNAVRSLVRTLMCFGGCPNLTKRLLICPCPSCGSMGLGADGGGGRKTEGGA